MQLDIMLFFQGIGSTVLDSIANALSFFGEEVAMILIVTMIYWCISKRKGFIILFNMLSALTIMNTLKAIFRVPRPFQVYPELIKGQRVETATGYSFPSGHSTGSAVFYSSLSVFFKKAWVMIPSIILLIGVPLSRLYLGVHWPMDVATGMIIGLGTTAFLSPLFNRLYEYGKKNRLMWITGWIVAVPAIAGIILLQAKLIDETAYSDLTKMLLMISSGLIGFVLEDRLVGFTTDGTTKEKVLRFLFGTIGIVLIQLIKVLLPSSLYYVGTFFRYTLIGLWISFLMPYLSVKLHIMHTEKENTR